MENDIVDLEKYQEAYEKEVHDYVKELVSNIKTAKALPYSKDYLYAFSVDRDAIGYDTLIDLHKSLKQLLGEDKKIAFIDANIGANLNALTKEELKEKINELQEIYNSME